MPMEDRDSRRKHQQARTDNYYPGAAHLVLILRVFVSAIVLKSDLRFTVAELAHILMVGSRSSISEEPPAMYC